MLPDLKWRNVAVVIAALVIASGYVAWGIIIATERPVIGFTGIRRLSRRRSSPLRSDAAPKPQRPPLGTSEAGARPLKIKSRHRCPVR